MLGWHHVCNSRCDSVWSMTPHDQKCNQKEIFSVPSAPAKSYQFTYSLLGLMSSDQLAIITVRSTTRLWHTFLRHLHKFIFSQHFIDSIRRWLQIGPNVAIGFKWATRKMEIELKCVLCEAPFLLPSHKRFILDVKTSSFVFQEWEYDLFPANSLKVLCRKWKCGR